MYFDEAEESIREERLSLEIYVRNICQLLDNVSNSLHGEGQFILNEDEFPELGRRKILCSYKVDDEQVSLTLDYSYDVALFGQEKSLDELGFDYRTLANTLEQLGISVGRESNHWETELYGDSNHHKDKMVLTASREKNKVLERNNKK